MRLTTDQKVQECAHILRYMFVGTINLPNSILPVTHFRCRPLLHRYSFSFNYKV